MHNTLLLFLMLLPQVATAQNAIAIRDVLTKSQDDGNYPLLLSYSGKLTHQYDEDAKIRLPFPDAHYKITHVKYRTTIAGGERTQRISVNGQRTDKTGKTSSIYFSVRESIPDFETLKSIKTIEEFEKELGTMGDALGAWGVNDVMHSSKHWSGCTVDSSGNLRCVKVFLHIANSGDGWGIDLRHIYEGAFRPIELKVVPKGNAEVGLPSEPK